VTSTPSHSHPRDERSSRAAIGDRIGSYELRGLLAEGRTAVVYEAVHTNRGFETPVAIKVLRSFEPSTLARLRASCRTMARFGGPHIARVHEVGALDSNEPFVVMDRLVGTSLREHLANEGALPIDVAVDVVLQLCNALARPHASDLVHGDINPTTLVIHRRADGGAHAALIGFVEGTHGGSAGYASPEQLEKRAIDARADVWALGVVLYEMITGSTARSSGSSGRHVLGALPSRISTPHGPVPRALEGILHRSTKRDRTARFANVRDLGAALAPFGSLRTRKREDGALFTPVPPVLLPFSGPVDDAQTELMPIRGSWETSIEAAVPPPSNPPDEARTELMPISGPWETSIEPAPSREADADGMRLIIAEVVPKRRWVTRVLAPSLTLLLAIFAVERVRGGELVGMATAAPAPALATLPPAPTARLAPLSPLEPGLLPSAHPSSAGSRTGGASSSPNVPRVVPAVRSSAHR
jgi:eukaryotic-like serine/threonine-protein kinase